MKIDYTGEILSGDSAEVRTVVVKANDRIPLNYRLLNEGGTWKVYDVVIEGVSLVSNYRSQFSRIIHESGLRRTGKAPQDQGVRINAGRMRPILARKGGDGSQPPSRTFASGSGAGA